MPPMPQVTGPLSFDIPERVKEWHLDPEDALAAGLITKSLFNSNTYSFAGEGNLNVPMGVFGFEIREHYLKKEVAEMIDNYFTMYGYRISVLKKPCIKNRTKWTYVKTNNCTIHGGIPNDDAEEIEEIFNKGITFWVNPSEVGNYTLENLPLHS